MSYSSLSSLRKLPFLFVGLLVLALTGCNSDDPVYKYDTLPNAAVTSFSLRTDSKVTGLDSIYFSVDLNRGVIYNADSLRKGTPINKLVPVIKFASTVKSAVLTMSGGTTRTGEVDYKKNPTDSIDFTGEVTLTVKPSESDRTTVYRIKVNVHREEADSMIWSRSDYSALPSRLPAPKSRRTIEHSDRVVSLIEESDGSFTLVSTSDLEGSQYDSRTIIFPFTPQVDSFCASENSFWILAADGSLHTSSDAVSWNPTGETWKGITGTYLDTVLGVAEVNGTSTFAQYPLLDLNVIPVPGSFPIRNHTDLVTLQNKWTSSPVAFMAGGITANGEVSDATWAFDGKEWIVLSRGGIPPLSGAAIVPYYSYRVSATGNSMVEYDVWLLVGGLLSDNTPNRTLYISYDNGVNWQKASASLQIDSAVPPMTSCDAVVFRKKMSASLSEYWKLPEGLSRIEASVTGDNITWLCPYIFIVDAKMADGSLYDSIWKGVLTRLTFTPVI